MPTRTERTEMQPTDFSVGMLMGLIRAGVRALDTREIWIIHAAFAKAFKVIQEEFGRENVGFLIILDRFHGLSRDIDWLMQYWLDAGYSTKDAPGTIFRFRMSDYGSEVYADTIPGGAEPYDKAVEVFLEVIRHPDPKITRMT